MSDNDHRSPASPIREPAASPVDRAAVEMAWQLCLALVSQRRAAAEPEEGEYRLQTGTGHAPALRLTEPGDPHAVARWLRATGWQVAPTWPPAAVELLNLYWPMLAAPQGIAVAQLCQSLDGWIATRDGDVSALLSVALRRHRLRLRALADAIVIGASIAAADDPALRDNAGPQDGLPMRVVLDPTARLSPALALFNDARAPAIVVCGTDHQRLAESRWGKGRVIGVPVFKRRLDLKALLAQLRERELDVVLVEGGGATIAHFLDAQCLDRLHLAQVGVLLGSGREGLHVPGSALSPARAPRRPDARVYRIGDDVMWDCDLRAQRDARAAPEDARQAAARLVLPGEFERIA
ncbi:MAG: RibD family protein [Burkholderiaceae bacterium]